MNLFSGGRTITALPLVYCGHPALRRQARPVGAITPDIRELAEQMVATMREHEGIGLAAPQVARNLRLIVLDIPSRNDKGPIPPTSPGEAALLPRMPLALVNPKLSEFSAQTTAYGEGCLSIPDVHCDVVRPQFVQLDARGLDGQAISFRCGGLLARCLQHEVDHLNGILFIDKVDEAALAPYREAIEQLKQRSARDVRT